MISVRGYFIHPRDLGNPNPRPADAPSALRALSELLAPQGMEAEALLKALGHQAKAILHDMARAGEIPAVPPLSPYTQARKEEGGFTYETGSFYRTMRVEVVRGGKRKKGFLAVALLPRGRTSRGLLHSRLLDIWNAGIVINITDPEAKRKVAAWLRLSGLGERERGASGRPIVIVIPPRDPIPPQVRFRLMQELARNFQGPLRERIRILSGLLTHEPWDPAAAARWRARLVSYANRVLAEAMRKYGA